MSANPETPPARRQPPAKALALMAIVGVLAGVIGSQLLTRLATDDGPGQRAELGDVPPAATAPPTSWIEPAPLKPPPPPLSETAEPPPSRPRRLEPVTGVDVEVSPTRSAGESPPAPPTVPSCLTRRITSSAPRDPGGYPLPPMARARIGSGAYALHGQIDQIEYLSDGEHLLARTFDGRLAQFRIHDGALMWLVDGLERGRSFVQSPRRGGVVVPACEGLVLLDAASGEELERWPLGDLEGSFAVTADGKAVLGLRRSRRNQRESLLTRWRVPGGSIQWSRPIGRDPGPVELSDDDARLAVWVQQGSGGGSAHWLVTDGSTGAELRRLPSASSLGRSARADFLPGTHTLVTSLQRDSVEAIAVDSGEAIDLPLAGEQTWRGTISADGTMALNRGGVVFSLDAGETVAKLDRADEDRNVFANLEAAAFSPDGTEVAAAGQGIARYNLRPARRIFPEEGRSLQWHYLPGKNALLLADDSLVFQGEDLDLERWAPPYREPERFGSGLVYGSPLGRGLGEHGVTAWTRSAWIRLSPTNPQGTRLASPPGSTHEWLLARGAEVLVRPPTEEHADILVLEGSGGEPRSFSVRGRFRHTATSEVSDDGRHLISVGAVDQWVWELRTGDPVHHLPKAFGGGFVRGSRDLFWYRPASRIHGGGRSSGGASQLWRIGGEGPLRELPGNGNLAYVSGQQMLVGAAPIQGNLQFHTLTSDQTYDTRDPELRYVQRVVVSDDGARIVTVHLGGVAYVWDTAALMADAGVPSTEGRYPSPRDP